jgi:NTE family protein
MSPGDQKDASKRRGLVLGGGGVLGAAWMIGALSALRDSMAWDPRESEVVVGTSAGSVVGSMLACGLSVDTLVNHQRGIVAPGDPQIGFDPDTASGGSLPPRPQLRMGSVSLVAQAVLHPRRVPVLAALSGLAPRGRGTLAAVADLVNEVNPQGQWPEHPELWLIAMDYDSGKRVRFGAPGAPPIGLAEAVMASCSIPGWFTPIEAGGRRYIDGGTLSPTSLDVLAGRGLDEVIVLAPMASFDYDEPTTVVAKGERRFRRAMTRRILSEAGKVRRTGTAVTILAPGREDLEAIGVNLMDHRRRSAVLDVALRTTAEALADPTSPLSAAG